MTKMTECYPCFREDVTADINALGLEDDVVYCENSGYDKVVYDEDADVTVWSGASRLVFPYHNLVCKLPVTKIVHWEENEDGEWGEEEYRCDFDDHCAVELENYELSIKEGLDKAFAPCEFYDMVNGIPVYVMERTEKMKKGITPSKATSEACEKDELDYSWDPSLWEVFVQYYGIEFCKKLTTFLQDNYINDIRFENCGIINGRPVLIDYCGYWED